MKKITLNKDWEYYQGTLGDIWEVWREEKYDDIFNVSWENITLPHCFNARDAVDPDKKYYQGPGWYRNKIGINNPYSEGRTLLHFEGAGQKTKAYVYKEEIDSHIGGYDEFQFDITEAINNYKEGNSEASEKIPICIRCDNSRDVNYVPSDVNDFNLYGGLYRNVNLVYVPPISLDKIFIDTEFKETDNVNFERVEVTVNCSLYNPEKKVADLDIEIILINPQGKEVKRKKLSRETWKKKEELFRFNINNPQLWSPESPELYQCKVKLSSPAGDTELEEKFGIRSVEFEKNGPFKLNGEKYYLKGTHRHEDHAGVGAAMTYDMIKKELKMIKNMGANFLRLGHYQQSREVLNLCDELGIIVWEEIPWSRGGLGGTRHKNHIKKMLNNMIEQHYNHPAVVFWGLGNEANFRVGDFVEHDKQKVKSFMRELNDIAHKKDSSRFTALRFCDDCKDIVDVYTPSIWAGWYHGVYTEYENKVKEEYNKTDCFLHIEWGGDNLAGRHLKDYYNGLDDDVNDYPIPARHGDWSESYYCELVEWILKCQENLDWLAGTAQWTFKDFSSPTRTDSPIPYVNLKGIVERDLTKKEAYYVFQSYWSEKPMVHIYGETMPVCWGEAGEQEIVKVYSNCPQVELFLNGKTCGKKERNISDFPAAGLRWQVKFKKGENKIKVCAEKNGKKVKDETQFYYQTQDWGEPTQLQLSKSKVERGKVFIEVKAFDDNEIFCPDADFFVEFGLTGKGKLLDNLGTTRGSRKIQLAGGRAGIYVETGKGYSVVSCSAENFETVFWDNIKPNYTGGK